MSKISQVEALPTQELTIVPRRNLGRIIAGVLVTAFLVWVAVSFANAQIDWGTVRHYLTVPVLIRGAGTAVVLTIVAMLLGVVLGIVTAVMRLSTNRVVFGVAWLYLWIFRGTPVYVQLLVWFNISLIFPYFGIPGVFEARTIDFLTPFIAATIALGLNQGAYASEIVRAGILSVDEGQIEAAKAIGMSQMMLMRRIILPQAMRVIVPPLGNELIGMLKTTSLASAIGVTEILSEAQHIYFVNSRIMELLIVCSIWYLAVVTVMTAGQFYVERHFAKGASSKVLPLTPIQQIKQFFGAKRRASL
ncbi:amino acid ABC transporter permease [Specibacter cremeus]|uniref:amino acid ABC transporter permease n=1 Tax=Specibacter cremeus TaxID=1629051 RepID=UPI000F795C97|nr:amino acid ABC transporter permease [Specibacter cremeus]